MKNRWTQKEINILKDNAVLSDSTLMTLLPGRSLKSIGCQKHRLGFARNRPNWTRIEIEKLKELYPCSKQEEILLALPDRAWTSIVVKAMDFDLKRHIPIKNRLLEKVQKNSGIFGELGNFQTECWIWIGHLDKDGYGQFGTDYETCGAHRISYKLFIGEISENLQLDHLCRIRSCVNPDHLEPVTSKQNLSRSPIHNINKTKCPKGHEYSGDNLFYYRNERRCRACSRQQNKNYRIKNATHSR